MPPADLPFVYAMCWLAHPKHRNYRRGDLLDFHIDSRDCVGQATELMDMIRAAMLTQGVGRLIWKLVDFSTRAPTGHHSTLAVDEWEEAVVTSTQTRDQFFPKGFLCLDLLTLSSQILHDDHLPQVVLCLFLRFGGEGCHSWSTFLIHFWLTARKRPSWTS